MVENSLITMEDRAEIDRHHTENGWGYRKISKYLNLPKWSVLNHLRGRTTGIGNAGRIHVGEDNCMWRGEDVSYGNLHMWLRRNVPLTDVCQICGESPAVDHANITGIYSRNLKDYICVCRKCHFAIDADKVGRDDKNGRFRKSG